jgi:hypothetical protein
MQPAFTDASDSATQAGHMLQRIEEEVGAVLMPADMRRPYAAP